MSTWGFYSTRASNPLIVFGWHFQSSHIHRASFTKRSSFYQIGMSDYSINQRNFHYNIRLLNYWIAASLFWCLFMSTVLIAAVCDTTCFFLSWILSKICLPQNIPPLKKTVQLITLWWLCSIWVSHCHRRCRHTWMELRHRYIIRHHYIFLSWLQCQKCQRWEMLMEFSKCSY